MTDDKPVRIIRAAHERDYFVCSRKTAQDKSISFEALGVLTYLLSQPDTWQANVKDIAKRSTEYKIYKILRELRKNGYMTLQKEKGEGRFSQWVYQVFETSQLIQNQQVENQVVENRHTKIVQKNTDSTEKPSRKREKVSKKDTIPAAQMNPMKDAIVASFGWDWKSMTSSEKGIVQSTAKILCTANFEPDRVGSFHAWCRAKFTHFTPKALASHLSEYRLARLNEEVNEPKRGADGLTTLERSRLQHMEVTGEQC